MKTETVEEFLKRGGKITKAPAKDDESTLTVGFLEKAQPSFFEQNTDELISEALGLPLDNEVGSGNVCEFFRRQASKQTSGDRRSSHLPEDQSDDTL